MGIFHNITLLSVGWFCTLPISMVLALRTRSIQSSAVITRSNITRYWTNHCRNWGKVSIWTHNRQLIPRHDGREYFGEKWPRYKMGWWSLFRTMKVGPTLAQRRYCRPDVGPTLAQPTLLSGVYFSWPMPLVAVVVWKPSLGMASSTHSWEGIISKSASCPILK